MNNRPLESTLCSYVPVMLSHLSPLYFFNEGFSPTLLHYASKYKSC